MRTEPTHIGHFADHGLIRCPRCAACAHLRPVLSAGGGRIGSRLVCPACAGTTEWLMERDGTYPLASGGPVLTHFGLHLWLQVPCCGEVLWAVNPDHLAFLEQYIGLDLRERRRGGWCNSSMQSRLPRWMLLGRNRAAVLAGLAKLRELAAAAG